MRAIACISVVIFHSFPKYMQGGFIGVDIFFVISGFLISSIIYRNLFDPNLPGQLNLFDFYLRRIRRIFPALITVLVFSLVVGWYVLLPEEYRLLGKHSFGGATYTNNIMLYRESSKYFNPDSNTKVLLHLWSLGVEEQFYLIFPIILFLFYRFNLNFILCLTAFTAFSFILNKNGIKHDNQSYSFYLPYCRFWELSIGALLAYIVNYHSSFIESTHNLLIKYRITDGIAKLIFRNPTDNNKKNIIKNILSVAGICLIIFGIFKVKNDLNFPGYIALIPVIGALLIIVAGREALVNKYILSNRIMVFLGLISYPLYLWHWPLLSFAYICEGQTPDMWIRLTADLIAVIMAILTYLFIEPPLRYGKHSRIKAGILFITLVFVGIIGNRIYHSDGYTQRMGVDLEKTFNANDYIKQIEVNNEEFFQECKKKINKWNDIARYYHTKCYLTHSDDYEVALIGDSQAAELFYGLATYIDQTKVGIASFSAFSLDNPKTFSSYVGDNYELSLNFIKSKNIKLVVFSYFYKNTKYENMESLSSELSRKIDYFLSNGIKVLFILKHPYLRNDYIQYSASSCSYRPFRLSEKKCSFRKKELIDKRLFEYRNTIKKICLQYSPQQVDIFDEMPLFCDNLNCNIEFNEHNLYYDEFHVNIFGSLYIGKKLLNKIEEMLKNK